MTGGVRTEWLDSVDSTNEEVRRRALAGERGPMWIAARRQSAGRGRRGREWVDLTGNLYATGLYVLDTRPADAAQLSFAAALAASEVCESVVDREKVRLKWPNDVLIDGRKTCGVLLESGSAPGGGLWLAVGIGLNVAAHPRDVERPATDLATEGGTVTREAALEQIAASFSAWLERWRTHGFGPLRDAWLARAWGIGERCTARLQDETVEGVFADLAPDGALRLDMADGRRRLISAGDVFFPGIPG
ncbi:MAG: biotin--[acetyl-CoA-carboxylase] ligase [Maricaulis sp.]|jgi:BirA family biotin operon repressor/biotin-[acetyl-CoA-carboxylase] ligase|nr:biotin--[acetyl-CoA-carboxylase] ligase [Maricaulis sp.]